MNPIGFSYLIRADREFSAAMQRVYALPGDKRKIILLENDLPDNY